MVDQPDQNELNRKAMTVDEILSALTDGVLVLDRTGRYLYMNKRVAKALKCEQSEIIGKSLREFHLPMETIDILEAKIKEVFDSGKPVTVEITSALENDSRYYRYALSALKCSDGDICAVLVTIKEITKRKKEEKERLQEIEISNLLLEAASALAENVELCEVADRLAETVSKATGRSRVVIDDTDLDAGELIFLAVKNGFPLRAGDRTKLSALLPEIQHGVYDRKTIVMDYRSPTLSEAERKQMDMYGAKLVLHVPILYGSELIGYIIVDEPGEYHEFTRRDIEVVQAIAAQAAIAIENARLYDKALARARTFEAVSLVGSLLTSTLSLKDTLEQAIDYSLLLLDAPSSVLLLSDSKSGVFKVVASQGISEQLQQGRLTINEVESLGLRRPTLRAIGDLTKLSMISFFSMESEEGFKSALISSLFIEGELRGLLIVQDKSIIKSSEEDMAVLRLYANQVSTAIKNAERFEAEWRIADTLQTALLEIPEHIQGVEFGHLYRSASEATRVGGDFFDIFELEHNRIGIVVGDVSGKGLRAASITSLVKNTVRAYAYEEELPSVIVSKTNDAVCKVTPTSYFVTLFFGIVDMKSGIITYCLAGHPPAILKRKSKDVLLLDVGSPILGAFVGLCYIDGKASIQEGDILLLYTDGITEARSSGGFFGEEGLIAFLETLQGISASSMSQVVFDEVMQYAGGELSDDVVLFSLSLEQSR